MTLPDSHQPIVVALVGVVALVEEVEEAEIGHPEVAIMTRKARLIMCACSLMTDTWTHLTVHHMTWIMSTLT